FGGVCRRYPDYIYSHIGSTLVLVFNLATVFLLFHTPQNRLFGCFVVTLFQRKSVKERYCLTVVTCLHVRTPQAGYLATSGTVSDNSWYCLSSACCSELMG
ncbi:MAG TPA: hypothetical protein ACHBZ9_06590, partial [Arsenophonus nasoniae]|uniref:hypothetical protein n=1 Tax=Arsenophonus nasoniae TaxID=638 RepID=UPI003878FCEC